MNKTKCHKCKLVIILLIACMPMIKAEIVDVKTDSIKDNNMICKRNNAYFQFLGSSYIYSLSYERLVIKKGFNNITVGVSYELLPFDWNIITPQINYFVGSNNHHALVGYSIAFEYGMVNRANVSSILLAYRYQRQKGGLFFQAGAAYKFKDNPTHFFSLLPTFAIGYTFLKKITGANKRS